MPGPSALLVLLGLAAELFAVASVLWKFRPHRSISTEIGMPPATVYADGGTATIN